MPKFIPAKPKCDWGVVRDAYVPSVTFCHLNLKNGEDNSRENLGRYQKGFWYQGTVYSLPFLVESYNGKYISP